MHSLKFELKTMNNGMQTIFVLKNYLLRAALVAGIAIIVIWPVEAADANPPDRMTYQGFVVDANETPIGSPNPRNVDIVFRVYDAAQAGTLLWAEQQTVTVDKGYFSVLLGEGTTYQSEPRPG